MTHTDERRAYPDCGSLDLCPRSRLGGYRCGDCGWTGGVTDWREPNKRIGSLPGLAGKLDAMDADEVGGEGA